MIDRRKAEEESRRSKSLVESKASLESLRPPLSLKDLFLRTTAQPSVLWLPLSDAQVRTTIGTHETFYFEWL